MKLEKLKIVDFANTGEIFHLVKYKDGIYRTQPKPENLDKYYEFDDYISHTNKNKTVTEIVYSFVKQIMFSKKYKLIKKHKPEINSVLDYGCGTGDFVDFLKSKKIKAIGFEPTSQAYEIARKKNRSTYQSLEKIKSKVDVITLFHVLEHVENYNEVIQNLKEYLNPNGLICIAVPNHKSYDAEYYEEHWAAWDVPRHVWHFSIEGMIQVANENNLELKQIKPMPFDAFYISMVSETYKGQSKLKGIWHGLVSNLKALHTQSYSSNIFVFKVK
ncbi:class I SAM-dependent methyltransferase [Psychroflexus aestuariivivens]|uniref:class I SAM-dependent methyltransferase n=1 Tax=Psychroflexus aestuariivivens TaxID=1795040 RepID=UPI001F00B887|nr:class I SAM-dependent methyltransferase [Psychroflexus aestuariivivens]